MEIRVLLTDSLVKVSGNAALVIPWKNIFENLVRKHRIRLTGWDTNALGAIRNPSEISNHLESLQGLRDAARQGTCCFERISAKELQVLESRHAVEVAAGKTAPKAKRKRRSDLGTNRAVGKEKTTAAKKVVKSRKRIESDDDDDDVEPPRKRGKSKRASDDSDEDDEEEEEEDDERDERDEDEEEEEDEVPHKKRIRSLGTRGRGSDEDGGEGSARDSVESGEGFEATPRSPSQQANGGDIQAPRERLGLRLGPGGLSIRPVVLGEAAQAAENNGGRGVETERGSGLDGPPGIMPTGIVNAGSFDESNIVEGRRERRPRIQGPHGWV